MKTRDIILISLAFIGMLFFASKAGATLRGTDTFLPAGKPKYSRGRGWRFRILTRPIDGNPLRSTV